MGLLQAAVPVRTAVRFSLVILSFFKMKSSAKKTGTQDRVVARRGFPGQDGKTFYTTSVHSRPSPAE